MFANLKKKLEEGVVTAGAAVLEKKWDSNGGANAVTVTSSPNYIHGKDSVPSPAVGKRGSISGSTELLTDRQTDNGTSSRLDDIPLKESSGSKEELVELLMKRTRQVKNMEAKYLELSSMMKDKTQMIEKLESALEKQQDVHCQRIQELNERYNSYRAKQSENIATAVKRKEDEMKSQMKDTELAKSQLEEKVHELERYKEKYVEHHEASEELEAFSTQELTKVKHLLLNAEEEIRRLKAERQSEGEVPGSHSDAVTGLEEQLAAANQSRSDTEAKNVELNELVTSLKASNDVVQTQLLEAKEAIAQMTLHTSRSQDDWLEKQIESERCISALEDQIRLLKGELTQSDTKKSALTKQLTDLQTEVTSLKSEMESLQEHASSQQTVIDGHSSVVADLQLQLQKSISECKDYEAQLGEMTTKFSTCSCELERCRLEFESSQKQKDEQISQLEQTVHSLQDDSSMMLQRVEELESQKENTATVVEEAVTARLRQEMVSLEDQLQEKTKVIKKQEQRLADLKKLLQRELKVVPPSGDESDTLSGKLPPSGASSKNLYIDCASAATAVSVHTAATHQSVSSSPAVELSLTTSPATLSISEVGACQNGLSDDGFTSRPQLVGQDNVNRVRSTNRRTSGTPGSASGSAVMPASDSEYDFMRELNFKYLRHVVLKFMLSREHEALQLIRAVSVLLHFTPEEQKLIRDTLEWKMSWFGHRPQLPAKGQMAKIIPPSY